MKNLNEMTSKELKEMAKELKVKSWWNLRKEELIAEIEKIQNSSEEKEARNEEIAREEAALAEYEKNWGKYTARYKPAEFLKKWRSGEIVLESEEAAVEAVREEMAKHGIEPNEEDSKHKLVPMPGIERSAELKAEYDHASTEEKPQDLPAEKPKPKRGALIEYNGRAQNICAWADELGISANTLYGRLYKLGWSVEKAFAKK